MDIGEIIFSTVLLFVIIYLSVALAIKPLINNPDETVSESKDIGLVRLRDIKVLSNDELEEIIELYQRKGSRKEDHEQYQKYAEVLKQLKEMGYFSDEQYSAKIDKLKEYFKVD